MYIEERVETLEAQIQKLQAQLEEMQGIGEEKFLTPKEVAAMMRCSVQTIYAKVQSGDIQADMSTGRARIPKTQFYKKRPVQARELPKRIKPAPEISGIGDIKKQLFG